MTDGLVTEVTPDISVALVPQGVRVTLFTRGVGPALTLTDTEAFRLADTLTHWAAVWQAARAAAEEVFGSGE